MIISLEEAISIHSQIIAFFRNDFSKLNNDEQRRSLINSCGPQEAREISRKVLQYYSKDFFSKEDDFSDMNHQIFYVPLLKIQKALLNEKIIEIEISKKSYEKFISYVTQIKAHSNSIHQQIEKENSTPVDDTMWLLYAPLKENETSDNKVYTPWAILRLLDEGLTTLHQLIGREINFYGGFEIIERSKTVMSMSETLEFCILIKLASGTTSLEINFVLNDKKENSISGYFVKRSNDSQMFEIYARKIKKSEKTMKVILSTMVSVQMSNKLGHRYTYKVLPYDIDFNELNPPI